MSVSARLRFARRIELRWLAVHNTWLYLKHRVRMLRTRAGIADTVCDVATWLLVLSGNIRGGRPLFGNATRR